jgi:signal transduction histidine kinase
MARDLHDAVIQPYVGLKLALEAVYREAGPGNPVAGRLAELIDMTEATLAELRREAASINGAAPPAPEALLGQLREQARRLERFSGVRVRLACDALATLPPQLAENVSRMIAEGLSNIARHTGSREAFVLLLCENARLVLTIGNGASGSDPSGNEPDSDARNSIPTTPFVPKTIAERAGALGGRVHIGQDGGFTTVRIEIPRIDSRGVGPV